ncbi:alpha-(1,3)-fucosyltransferase 10 [Arctopsyche grandis]|uniref:alpha-(1,3)-fucosyltransferase 10 n=1 Tax=Arctopsyche grandis TaxID=121162 RepID=UPI00406D95A7
MKYIPIDSYGECLNNKKLSAEYKHDYLNKLDDHDFLTFVNRYKFTIAIENGICEDYITEKLWRPLKVGSVPIYMGSPSIRDWLPNQQSAIVLNDFESLEDLAAYLNHLNTHDDEYEKYLQHKINKKITNSKLIDFIKQHNDEGVELFTDTFQCFICNKHYEESKISSILTQSHYNCTKPVPPLKTLDTWWLSEWYNSKKEAEVLNKFVIEENRQSFTRKEFFTSVADIESTNVDVHL